MENIYYSPEAFGLEIVTSIDDPDACYSFDMLVVWRNAEGELFYSDDSGCSCPSPFEAIRSVDDLTRFTKFREIQEVANQWAVNLNYRDDPDTARTLQALTHELLMKVDPLL